MFEPKWKTIEKITHLRYGLPQHVHAAATYPLAAPNGSEIIVLGHNNGLLVLWRGGRPFKEHPTPNLASENTSSTQDMVVVDNSDDESALPSPNELTDTDTAFDPRAPYLPIVQHLDLPLGTAVLSLAFPRLPCLADAAEREDLRVALLREKMVVAVACADASVRLLTLPMMPPSPASKARRKLREDPTLGMTGRGSWGEEMFTISGARGHQSLPKGVSVCFARRSTLYLDEDEDEEDDIEMADDADPAARVDVLIASHSADLDGLLLIHRLPVSDNGLAFAPAPGLRLWRRQRLSGPATVIDLHVPVLPSDPTKNLFPPKVLITPRSGPVQIFVCASKPHRRGYFALALSAGLQPHTTSAHPQHRRMLAAHCVLAGRAVVALTVDGEWGIWDITPPSPGTESAARGITGAIPTPFALSGRIGASRRPTAPAPTQKSSSGKPTSGSALAPMTPGARKMRQDALFARPSSAGRSAADDSDEDSRGGIAVSIIDPVLTNHRRPDEFVLFWRGGRAVALPSLRSQWEARLRPGSAGGSTRVKDLPSWEADLGGDRAVAVAALPNEFCEPPAAGQGWTPELLVAGERALVLLAAPVEETVEEPSPQNEELKAMDTQLDLMEAADNQQQETDGDSGMDMDDAQQPELESSSVQASGRPRPKVDFRA